jgi:beta-lactamase class A
MTPPRRTPTGRRGHRFAALAILLALSITAGAAAGASAAAPAVGTATGLLSWIDHHPKNAGLAVLRDDGRVPIAYGATRRYPLASTRKVLIAGALTSSGADLSRRVPRSEVERFYVPGTDGGAHEDAALDPLRPSLRQLLRAMIDVSDNASADALLVRVGAGRVDAWGRRHGLTRQDPIYPLLGELAAWKRDLKWTQRSPRGRALVARALARVVPAQQVTLPDLPTQRVLADHSVAGAPAQWARLMRRIGRHGDPELVTTLDWPRRRSEAFARRFDRYLTKGGSLPGVVTEASYVQPAGRPGVAVALFLRDLPPDGEAILAKTYAQQDLIAKLAEDAAFRQRAQRVLRGR